MYLHYVYTFIHVYIYMHVSFQTILILTLNHSNILYQKILTSARKITKHQISTKTKLLWTVIYLRYVFHVVTAGMPSTSSKKHSWRKESWSLQWDYRVSYQLWHGSFVVLFWICKNKKILLFEAKWISTNTNHYEQHVWCHSTASIMSIGTTQLFEKWETL